MDPRRLLARLVRGDLANVSFSDVRRLVESFGFQLRRTSGSHHIFVRPDVPELLSLQEVRGQAKPYQSPVPPPGRAVRFEHEGRSLSDYHVNVFYSDEDGGYIADIPDLEACSAFGATPQEALAEVEQAKEAWLAAAREAGRPIPEPRYRPAIYAR